MANQIHEITFLEDQLLIPKFNNNPPRVIQRKGILYSHNPDGAATYNANLQAAIFSIDFSCKVKELLLLYAIPLTLENEVDGRVMTVLILRNLTITTKKIQVSPLTEIINLMSASKSSNENAK